MNNIYVLWWQGIQNAPDIIKICYKSLLQNHDQNSQRIHLIDSTNFNKYVNIPEYILKKYEEGLITLTHLSDFIRCVLLYENGGLWIDASVLLTKAIDEKIFEKDLFIMKNPKALEKDITSKWEPFLIGGKKESKFFKLFIDFFLEYWKKEDELITYLLIEHIFYIAYKENNKFRKILDEAKSFYYPIDYFQKILNEEYDQEKFQEICLKEDFLKLTYKSELEIQKREKLTYYGKLKEIYNV